MVLDLRCAFRCTAFMVEAVVVARVRTHRRAPTRLVSRRDRVCGGEEFGGTELLEGLCEYDRR